MKKITIGLLILLVLTPACSLQFGGPTQPVEQGLPTPSPAVGIVNPSPLAGAVTLTPVPKPVRSPTPTPVPIPTRTASLTPTEPLPTPPAGKVILIEYFDKYYGDAPILLTEAYMGKHLPRLVIYTDGQVIYRDDTGALLETSMTDETMCTLLGGIRTIGFFKAEGDGTLDSDDPIYGDISQKYLDITDSTNFILIINGNPSKWVKIYRPYVDSLVRPIKSTWELFNNFVPEDLEPYEPDLYAAWIESEQKLARTYGAGVDLQPAIWPAGLQKPDKILGDEEVIQVPMDPEEVDPLLMYFDVIPGVKLFEQGQDRYSIILRPLLPHEEMDILSPVTQQSRSYGLPFECGN
jgi:hypothetical protein